MRAHRLLRERATQPEKAQWAATVVRILQASLPGRAWRNPAVWPQWRPLLPHILEAVDEVRPLEDIADEIPLLLQEAGNYLLDRGESRAAGPLFERAYQLNSERLDPDNEVMLDSAIHLARALQDLGEYERACALDEDTVARRRRVLGADHPDTLTSVSNLAVGLRALGENERAQELEDEAARRRRGSDEDGRV